MNISPFQNAHIDLQDMLIMSRDNEAMLGEYIAEVMKIKQCIYAGYKLNTATYNKESGTYICDRNGLTLDTTSYLVRNLPNIDSGKTFEDIKPRRILYDSVIVKKNIAQEYTAQPVNCISVLSGFINCDVL